MRSPQERPRGLSKASGLSARKWRGHLISWRENERLSRVGKGQWGQRPESRYIIPFHHLIRPWRAILLFGLELITFSNRLGLRVVIEKLFLSLHLNTSLTLHSWKRNSPLEKVRPGRNLRWLTSWALIQVLKLTAISSWFQDRKGNKSIQRLPLVTVNSCTLWYVTLTARLKTWLPMDPSSIMVIISPASSMQQPSNWLYSIELQLPRSSCAIFLSEIRREILWRHCYCGQWMWGG